MSKMRAMEPEGHKARAVEPEGLKARLGGDDDTEGHSFSLNPIIGQQLSRAREQEIQRNLKRRQARDEASRPHKK